MQAQSIQAWRRADAAAQGGAQAARVEFSALLGIRELEVPARLRLLALDLEEGSVRAATAQALAAAGVPESEPALLLELARRLLDLGEVEAGLRCLRSPAIADSVDASTHANAGRMLGDLSFYDLALVHLERAQGLGLAAPGLHYLIGMARMYCGDVDSAEEALETCLQGDPGFMPALRLLSTLRRQTSQHNHLDRLRAAQGRLGDSHVFAPLVQYALFKELDDLGQNEAAWTHLARGMSARRAQIAYDEAADEALFKALLQWSPTATTEAFIKEGPTPLFIVSMPRSGSTLLERLLAAHPDVADAGELRDFVCQLRWCSDSLGGPHPDAALIAAAAQVDPALLGHRYMEHAAWRSAGRGYFIDKLPANFLFAGLIAAALPRARIVHMVRDPMDSCFSNLKVLFGDAYPHTYSQPEMARHYLRYRGLMAHWTGMFPGRILEVSYESLVTDPQTQARRVLDFCGLPWTDAVMGAGGRTGMISTASTVQVREPIHTRYLGQWRPYARHLVPLQTMLGCSTS